MTIERIVADLSQRTERRWDAKYRGIVVDNADPDKLGRLRLKVASVTGEDVETDWADACVPYGGSADQGMLFIPEIGSGVWVEYEEGFADRPVWVGTFWSKPSGESELPQVDGAIPDPPTTKLVKTAKGHMLAFEDKDDQESINLVDGVNGNTVTMDSDGIVITDANDNTVTMTKDGIVVTDANSNEIKLESSGITLKTSGTQVVLGSSGVNIGGSGATEPIVLGQQFDLAVKTFMIALKTHTHVGNLGAPTSPPTPPIPDLTVPLSTKHKVE